MKYKGYNFSKDDKMRSYGEVDGGKKIVRINVKKSKKKGKKGEVLNSILHEKFHIDHPKATEKTTYKKVKEQMAKLTKQHKKRIYSLIK